MVSLICLATIVLRTNPDIVTRLVPISLSSDEYRDLEPFGKAIGRARIVQLGEQTHGDGTSFEVKVRLVKYLHEKLGFDVLVWESSLMECEAMNDGLKGKDSIVNVARSGVFGHWSLAKESIGVFEYARRSYNSPRPLRMSGFDIQSSGALAAPMILELIKPLRHIDGLVDSVSMFSRADDLTKTNSGAAKEASLIEFSKPVDEFFVKNKAKIFRSIGKVRASEMEHYLQGFLRYREMMVSFARYQKSQTGEEMQIGYNIRESANAKNVEWLADTKYKGKKLILWAHNAHVSHHGADGHYRKAKPGEVILDSTGRIIKEKFGTQMYSIGFIASGGNWSWMGNPTIPFVPAEKGSLEHTLAQSGFDLGFINLKQARSNPSDPLNQPISGYMNRQNGKLDSLIWPNIFDGLIYVRDMKPRTSL